jgi:hypothetical protein
MRVGRGGSQLAKFTSAVCVATLVCLLAAPAMPRDVTGTIEGMVYGLDDKPVPSARVLVQESGNGEHPHAALTDQEGRFAFQRFLPGAYDLRASYLGIWSPWEKNVRLQTGKTTKVTLRIPASPSKDVPVQPPPASPNPSKP